MFNKCYAFQITILSLSSKTFRAIENIISGSDENFFIQCKYNQAHVMDFEKVVHTV